MEELQNAEREIVAAISRLSIAESVKNDMSEDLLRVGAVLRQNGGSDEVNKIVAGLNGSMIAFLDYAPLMEPYAKWKKAIAAIMLK